MGFLGETLDRFTRRNTLYYPGVPVKVGAHRAQLTGTRHRAPLFEVF